MGAFDYFSKLWNWGGTSKPLQGPEGNLPGAGGEHGGNTGSVVNPVNVRNPYTFVPPLMFSGNYWTQTGEPWVSESGRKAVMTEWFWQPLRGQPRRVDTTELRQFAQSGWVYDCVHTLIQEICACDWDVVPKDEATEYSEVEEDIKRVKEFLDKPNQNGDSFNVLLRAFLKDLFEIDAGVFVKVYTRDSYDFTKLEPKSGAPYLKPLHCPYCNGGKELGVEETEDAVEEIERGVGKALSVCPPELKAVIADRAEATRLPLLKARKFVKAFKPDAVEETEEPKEGISGNEGSKPKQRFGMPEDEPVNSCPFCNGTGLGRQLVELYARDGACLNFGTMIETDNGFIPIGKIVNERIPCLVKSYNQETRQIEWKPVVNWFNNGITTDWIRLKAKTNRKFRSLIATSNHNILTPNGFVQAGDLSIGDIIYTQQEKLSADQQQVILGSLLGDASLIKGGTKYAKLHLSETHGIKQKEYLLWKATILKPLGIRVDEFSSRYDENHEPTLKVRISTRANIVFDKYYLLKYPQIKPEIVDELTDLGLAIWIQDDGYYTKYGAYSISCGNTPINILNEIAEKLSVKFGITFKTRAASRENTIDVCKADSIRLIEIIKPFIHPSMVYKVGNIPCGDKLSILNTEMKTTLIETEIFEKSRFNHYDARYDIEVADNHNFFAQGMLVSNSFLKEADKFGYTRGYWQYSYQIPAHPCLTPDTLIATDEGYIPIRDVYAGDSVLTKDGEYNFVKEQMVRPFEGEIYVVKVLGKPALRITPEHPVLTKRGWVDAKDLNANDFVFAPKEKKGDGVFTYLDFQTYYKKPVHGPTAKEIPVMNFDADLAEVFGLYLAEGYTNTRIGTKSISFTFNANEKELQDKVKNFFTRVGVNFDERERKGATELVGRSAVLASWFHNEFGKYSYGKRVPDFIFNASEANKIAFLKGWFEGDGSYRLREIKHELSGVTTSPAIAQGIEQLANSLGFRITLYIRKAIEGHREAYLLTSTERSFISLLGFIPKEDFRETKHYEIAEDGLWLPIRTIDTEHYDGLVYNLSVENEQNYAPYGFIVHNCWFNKDEIIYGMMHPRSMSVYGYAATQAVLDVIKALKYSAEMNRLFIEENAVPNGIISVDTTSSEEFERFVKSWSKEVVGKPHKTPIVNAKSVEFKPFVQSTRELEFLETQKWYFRLVVSCFGLSMDEMGFAEKSNRANAATQVESVRRRSIRPILKAVETLITAQLLPEFNVDNVKFKFTITDLQEEKTRREVEAIDLQNGVITVDEVRKMRGLEPLPPRPAQVLGMNAGLPTNPLGGVQAQGGSASSGPEAFAEQQTQDSYDSSEAGHDKEGEKPGKKPFEPKEKTISTQRQEGQYQEAPASIAQLAEKPNISTGMHEVNGFPVPDDARCPQCGSTLIAPIGLDNWRCQNCHAEWISLPQGMMMQQPKASVVSRPSEPRGQMYSHECGLEKGHGIIARSKDWTVKKWLAKDYAPDLQKMLVLVKAAEFSDITDLNSRQKEKLREVLAWALETDAKLKDVENKVYSIVRDKARAEVIARTELSRVSTESDLDKYEEHGVKKVEWNAVPDEKCCDECWEKNGNEYSLAKAANLIPAHPCCRCLFIAVE